MHALRRLRHKHAHQRKARSGLLELDIGGPSGHRKAHGLDQLALFESRGVHALEEVLGRNLAPTGDHDSTQTQHRTGIACRGVVVGQRAAHRASRAHLPIANAAGQFGQRGNGVLHLAAGGDIGMTGHGADLDLITADADSRQTIDLVEVHNRAGLSQAQLHGRNQALAAGQKLPAGSTHLIQRPGIGVTEGIHICCPLFLSVGCVQATVRGVQHRWLPTRGAGWQACPDP